MLEVGYRPAGTHKWRLHRQESALNIHVNYFIEDTSGYSVMGAFVPLTPAFANVRSAPRFNGRSDVALYLPLCDVSHLGENLTCQSARRIIESILKLVYQKHLGTPGQ